MQTKAFTLFEMLLVMSLLAMMAFIAVPVYQTFQVSNDLESADEYLVQSLKRAQSLAHSAKNDSNWGVHVTAGTISLFSGASYVLRDTNFDETFTISNKITPTGLSDLVFTKLTGLPDTTGSFTLTGSNSETRTITVNSKGTVSH
jgi:prepilin-type N-terminal cleavage/methylation domain-containing protein